MKKAVMLVVAGAAVIGLVVSSADARPKYKTAWDAEYLKEGSAIHKALDGKSNCMLCHQGKDKKKRNAYGMAVGNTLGAKNVMDLAKITEALKKAAAEKAPGSDKTFGDMIKDGTLKPTPDEQ